MICNYGSKSVIKSDACKVRARYYLYLDNNSRHVGYCKKHRPYMIEVFPIKYMFPFTDY